MSTGYAFSISWRRNREAETAASFFFIVAFGEDLTQHKVFNKINTEYKNG
jgi:hypothetical protein